MANRTYSYYDPVLANKMSALADQFVNGPARAAAARTQAELAQSEIDLNRQKYNTAQDATLAQQAVAHHVQRGDLASNPVRQTDLMANLFLSGINGNALGQTYLAMMGADPLATDDQMMRAFTGAGNGTNQNTAFSTAGQNNIAARDNRLAIARDQATPTKDEVLGMMLQQQPEAVQLAALFGPQTIGAGSTVQYAPGDPRATQGNTYTAYKPKTESEVKGEILAGLPADQQLNATTGHQLSPGAGMANAAGAIYAEMPQTAAQQGLGRSGSGRATPRNWTHPETGETGITLDGVTDANSGQPIPAGANISQTYKDATLSPQDMVRMAQLEGGIANLFDQNYPDSDYYIDQGDKTAILADAVREFKDPQSPAYGSMAGALQRAQQNLGMEVDTDWFSRDDIELKNPAQVPQLQPVKQGQSAPSSTVSNMPTDNGQQIDKAGKLLQEARAAIEAGAPRDKVIERLVSMGVNPDSL